MKQRKAYLCRKSYFVCPQCGKAVVKVVFRDSDGTFSGYATCTKMCRTVAVADYPTSTACGNSLHDFYTEATARFLKKLGGKK